MIESWWRRVRSWNPFHTEEVRLAFAIENASALNHALNYELVILRARCFRATADIKSVYSATMARGKLQDPGFRERFRTLIEGLREAELLFQAYSLRAAIVKDEIREVIALQKEIAAAVHLGIRPPQLSSEQEALLKGAMSPKIFAQELVSVARKAVAERSLDEYARGLGCAEMPAELAVLVNQTYEDYFRLIADLVAKETEEARKRQEEEVRRLLEEQQLQAAKEEASREPFNPPEGNAAEEQVMGTTKPRVFVIHGHDLFALRNAEVLLHRMGCQPITFAGIQDKGARTNIENLEKHLPSCEAVVVLMTPDDEGRKRGTDAALEPRARQNVLVEAGFALISRRKTSLIVALGDVSIPSDFDGINRIQTSAWNDSTTLSLARELSNMLQLPLDVRHF